MKYILTENQVKKLIKKKLGIDLTDKIEMVTSRWDLPTEFRYRIPSEQIGYYLNQFGPMFLIESDNKRYLVQYRTDDYYCWAIGKGDEYNGLEYEIPEHDVIRDLGVHPLGLTLDDLINAYIEE